MSITKSRAVLPLALLIFVAAVAVAALAGSRAVAAAAAWEGVPAGVADDSDRPAPGYDMDAALLARVEVFDGVFDLWPLNLLGTPREREIRIDADLGLASSVQAGTGLAAPVVSVDRAAFRLEGFSGAVTLAAGLDKPRWGAGHYRTLILSDSVRPYAQLRGDFQLNTRVGELTYRRLAGKLEPNEDTYLLAHRVEYSPGPWLRLGATETAVTSGRFASLAVNWMPLWPYYLTQHMLLKGGSVIGNNDDNDNLALDATISLGQRGSFYGELFVDDMPQTPDNHGVYQIGFLAGATTRLPIAGGTRLDAEYARVNNYTYTFQDRSKSYLHYGQPLGFALGPDSDSLIVMATKALSQPLELGLGFELRRHGPGRLGDVWEEIGWEEGRKRTFLYEGDGAAIEKTYLGRVQMTYKPTAAEATWAGSGLEIEGSLAFGLRENAANIPGTVTPALEVTTSVSWGWPGF